MTTTAIISAVSFGTSTNIGDYFNPTKTALQAGTTAVQIVVSITRGTVVPHGTKVIVYQACSPVSYSSALVGSQAVASEAQATELVLYSDRPTMEMTLDLFVTASGYHYCWIQAPTLSAASTITVNLEEIP